jgi:hypothetical protein
MTIINSYGIGSGAAISQQIDDDDERERRALRRKRDISHAAEQEFSRRLSSERIQNPESTSAAFYQTHTKHADLLRDSTQPGTSGRKSKISDEKSLNSVEPAEAIQTEEKQFMTPAESTLEIQQKQKSLSQELSSLIDSLSGLSMRTKEEKILAVLKELLSRFDSSKNVVESFEDFNEASGSLEFLAGYFEVDQKNQASTRKIADTVQGLQDQMSQISDALQIAVSGKLPVSSNSSLLSPTVRSLYLKRNGMDSSNGVNTAGSQAKIDEHESDREGEMSAAIALSEKLAFPRASVRSRSQSSQECDADKRKDETLIAVTLRSV